MLAPFVCASRARLGVLGETLSASWLRQLKLFASKRRPARWEKLKQEEAATWQRSRGECGARLTVCVQGGKFLPHLWLFVFWALPCIALVAICHWTSRAQSSLSPFVTQKCWRFGGFSWLRLSCVRKLKWGFFFISNWQLDNYDLHLLVIADSISQHGDLLEHNVSSEICTMRLNCPWMQRRESESVDAVHAGG